MLEKSGTGLKEYVGFVENLNNSKEEFTKLEEAKGELENMKTQLSKYRVKDEN